VPEEIPSSAMLVLLSCTFLQPAGKKLLYPKLPVMNWGLLCCPACCFFFPKDLSQGRMVLHGGYTHTEHSLWWKFSSQIRERMA